MRLLRTSEEGHRFPRRQVRGGPRIVRLVVARRRHLREQHTGTGASSPGSTAWPRRPPLPMEGAPRRTVPALSKYLHPT